MNRGLDMSVVMPGAIGLSGEGAAAYFRLCWGLWCQGGRVDKSKVALANFAGVPHAHWPRVWEEIAGRFEVSERGVRHAAVSAALEAAQVYRDSLRRRSELGVAARQAARAAARLQQVDTYGLPRVDACSQPQVDALTVKYVEEKANENKVITRVANPRSTQLANLRLPQLGYVSVSGSESDLLSSDPRGSGSGSDAGARDSKAEAIRAVFAHYRKLHPRSFPRPGSKSREWAKIAARLGEGYSAEDLCRAIDGYHLSPFHCGDNDRQTKFLDLDLLMRSGTHVNRGIEFSVTPPVPIMTAKERRTARAVQTILQDNPLPPPDEASPWNTSAISANSAWR